MRSLYFLRLVIGGLWIILSAGCGKREKQVVVLYSSIDEGYSREVVQAFSEETGIEVKLVSDTEVAKSTGLISRLKAEQSRPVADVFLSGDTMRATQLKKLGISQASPDLLASVPELAAYSDSAAHYIGFAPRLRVIIYNINKAREQNKRPEKVEDLATPEFAMKSCMANPLFGTTSMHAAALFEAMGSARATSFFQDFARYGGRILASNGEVKKRVANGEFSYGLTDSDDVSVALSEGKGIGYIVPDQNGMGAVVIPCAAVQIKGCPNPEAAAKLMAFMASEKMERIMSGGLASHFAVREQIPHPPVFGFGLSEIKLLDIDHRNLAMRMDEEVGTFLEKWVEAQQR